jgi:hypothetical protein
MSLEETKKPDRLITVFLQELIKDAVGLQDNTCSLFLLHHFSYGFVQKWRISTHVGTSPLKVVQLD